MLKYRQKYGQFAVEGRKSVHELIHSDYRIDTILATSAFASLNQDIRIDEIIPDAEYKKLSSFDTAPGILAVAFTRKFDLSDLDETAPLSIALDHISDPGNMGTILRTADWYGIQQVILSEGCTDFYNPKTISATMGSFTRIRFFIADLPAWLQGRNAYGCFLKGENIHLVKPVAPAILVIGSESHGITPDAEKAIRNRITIPGAGHAESLNASVAAGIAMDNFVRILGN